MPQQTLLANEFSKNNPLRASICDLVTPPFSRPPRKNRRRNSLSNEVSDLNQETHHPSAATTLTSMVGAK